MKKHYFIAGTDTNVGKTAIAAAMLIKAQQQGLSTAAIKPLAAGCCETVDGLRNEDAVLLHRYCSVPLAYEQVNPVALREAVAPHVAALHEGKQLRMSRLAGYCRGVMFGEARFTVIEGAGGWRVPLNNMECLSDLPKELNLPVILVVGLRLGCLNHAMLTAEIIRLDGLRLAGWVANQLDASMPACQENITFLSEHLCAPCIGIVPFLEDPSPAIVANYLDINKISQ